jgi:signal transduction histidine kinase
MGISLLLLCGLIGWWWHGVYQEEQGRLVLEATEKFQTWKSDAIDEAMMNLLLPDITSTGGLPDTVERDTLIHIELSSKSERSLGKKDSMAVRIDVTSDSQQVITKNFVSELQTVEFINSRLEQANEIATGSIRMVLLRVGTDSLGPQRNVLLSDTLSGGALLGSMDFRVGYRNYRSHILWKMLPEIGLGLLVVASLGFAFWLTFRNLREQQRALAAKDNFISNITHELKTPIATVGVALEALEHFGADANPNKRREYLAIGRRELGRLSRLTERALGILQFDHHEVALDRTDVDLAELVSAAWDSLHHKHELPPDRLQLSVEGPTSYYGDRLHLQNLVFNLLDNACKYGGDPPTIRVVIRPAAKATEIRVTDNGPGIPAGERDKIFRKFYRIRDVGGHRVKGHGLGLSYAREVAEVHGGTIRVSENTSGTGATFVVTLPQTEHYV